MLCSDINETEESPFAYVELSHVIARNGMPQLRLNGVMGLPIATISTGNNDLPGALPHKSSHSHVYATCQVAGFYHRFISVRICRFRKSIGIVFPFSPSPYCVYVLSPAPHLTHLFHSPPLLIPQLPSPSPSPPPVRLVTISSPAPSSILETWHSIPTHPRTHQNLIPTSEARAKTRCHDTLTRRDTRYESIG